MEAKSSLENKSKNLGFVVRCNFLKTALIPILIVELLADVVDLDEQHLYTTYVLWMCVWKFYRSFGP